MKLKLRELKFLSKKQIERLEVMGMDTAFISTEIRNSLTFYANDKRHPLAIHCNEDEIKVRTLESEKIYFTCNILDDAISYCEELILLREAQ